MLDFWDILILITSNPNSRVGCFLNVKGDLFHQISWTCLAQGCQEKPNENDGIFPTHLVPVSNFKSFKQRNSRNFWNKYVSIRWKSILTCFNYRLYEHGIKQNLFSFCWGTIHQKNRKTPSCGFKSCSFSQFSKRHHHTTHLCHPARSRLNFPHFLTNRSSLVRVTLSPTTKSTLGCWFVEGAGNR